MASGRWGSDTARQWGVTALVALLAAALALLDHPVDATAGFSLWFVGPALAVAYAVVEGHQVHVELRRQTWSLSLSELPLVVGLFVAPTWVVLAARLVGYAYVAVSRRTSPVKVAFNASLFTAEVLLASVVLHVVSPAADPVSAIGWVGGFLAGMAAAFLSAVGVALALAVTRSRLDGDQFRRLLAPTLSASALSALVGLLGVTLASVLAWSVIPLVLVLGALVLAFRRYGALLAEHRDLAELYDVTAAVSRSLADEGLVDPALLERVRVMLRARKALLWSREEETATVATEDAPLQVFRSAEDEVRRRAVRGAGLLTRVSDADGGLRPALERRQVRQLVAVPLRSGDDVLGTLEVEDREGELAQFEESDRTLLATLATHLGVALENRRLLARLRHEAQHDPLTGLPNRRAFVDRLDADLALLPPCGRMAVLVLDLQAFKDVNDALGRGVADLLLVEVGARVRGAVADPRAVARLSSDELAVAAPVQDADEARAVALRLQEALSAPVDAGGVGVHLGAVVGIALSPDHGRDAVTLCQHADVAMYAAKGTGRGVLTYTPTMDAGSVRRVGLVPELRRALAGEPSAGRIVPWYQPQVSLERAELVGVEALVRWEHPEEGLLAAGEFVPLAERTGLIGRLTTSVLEASLADLRRWVDAGHTFGVSVNVSVRSLLDPGFAEEVTHAIAAAGVPAHLVTLEITETGVVSDLARTVPVLTALRSLGVRLSVDDFGTGQSSLTYLRRLPVSEVKVDRSFVAGLVHEPGDLAVVRAVVDLSRPLGLTVVAEGVETEEARELLREVGCTVAQGYLLSRPLTAEDLERWMQRRTVSVPGTGGGRARRLRVVS